MGLVVRRGGAPQIVLSTTHLAGAVRIRCDLDPIERTWDFDAWRTIVRILLHLQPLEQAGLCVTPEQLQRDGLAIAVARGGWSTSRRRVAPSRA